MWWKSESLSGESIKPPTAPDNNLNLNLNYFNNPAFRVEFNGSCVNPDTFFHNKKH